MVVTLPGGTENTQVVVPSRATPISAVSSAGGDGRDISRNRSRTAQAITTGATHKDPSQVPAHHSCHSRKKCAPHRVFAQPKAPRTALAAAPSATARTNFSTYLP